MKLLCRILSALALLIAPMQRLAGHAGVSDSEIEQSGLVRIYLNARTGFSNISFTPQEGSILRAQLNFSEHRSAALYNISRADLSTLKDSFGWGILNWIAASNDRAALAHFLKIPGMRARLRSTHAQLDSAFLNACFMGHYLLAVDLFRLNEQAATAYATHLSDADIKALFFSGLEHSYVELINKAKAERLSIGR